MLVGSWAQDWLLGPCPGSVPALGLLPAGTRGSSPTARPHSGAVEAWAQLRGAKVQPGMAGLFATPGPAAPLAARLGLFIPHPQPLHGTEGSGGKAKEVKLLWGRNDTTHL